MASVGLGDRARDRVTGFEGIVVARTEWLGNCDRLTIQPPVGADGKVPDQGTFDEPHVELLERTAFSQEEPTVNGGPRPAPVRTGVR